MVEFFSSFIQNLKYLTQYIPCIITNRFHPIANGWDCVVRSMSQILLKSLTSKGPRFCARFVIKSSLWHFPVLQLRKESPHLSRCCVKDKPTNTHLHIFSKYMGSIKHIAIRVYLFVRLVLLNYATYFDTGFTIIYRIYFGRFIYEHIVSMQSRAGH